MNQVNFSPVSRVNDYAGLMALYLFAFSAFNHVAHANFTFTLLLLATLPKLSTDWRYVLNDGLFRLALVFIIYILLRTAWALWHSPVPIAATLDGCAYWLRRSALPALVVAYWLNADARRMRLCILLLFIGFVTRILMHLDWQVLATFLDDHGRASFANAPINFGLWNAIMFLATLVLARALLENSRNRLVFWCKLVLWAGGVVVAVNGVIFSQSRGAWLATLIVLPACLLWLALRRPREQPRRHILRWCAIGLAAVTAFGAVNYHTITARLSQEHAVFSDILSGDFSDVPPTSVGLRIDMYAAAWRYWRRKPIVGWGPGSSPYLLARAGKPLAKYHFPHFHDGYIDTLVQLGIVGFCLFSGLLFLTLKALLGAARKRTIPDDLAVFIFGTFMLVAVVALINKPLGSRFGDYFLALFTGFAYTARLTSLLQISSRQRRRNTPNLQAGDTTSGVR